MLAGYPVLAAFGLGATGVAFAATLALVRAFGVRRAKVIAQVLGAIAGAVIFLVSQAANLVPADMRRELASWMKSDAAQAWLGEHSPLWLPARALFGDLFAALVTVAVGLGLFVGVVFLCERIFLEGTRESEATPSRGRPASATRGKFRSGLARVVIVKELRLLWRDPKLITQVLLQVLYLLPLIFIVMRRGTATDILAPVVILISATLAGNLAWMTVSGEEAPDLVRSAPVPGQKVLWLKVAAALVAPLAICVPFIVIYGMRSMAALAAFVLCLVGCLTTSAVVQVWNARPGSGRDLKKRMQSSKMTNLVEFMAAIGWAGACYALLQGLIWPALGGLVVGLAMPVLAWYFRRDPLASDAT
jgi:ABC-2 type transport system permease protein